MESTPKKETITTSVLDQVSIKFNSIEVCAFESLEKVEATVIRLAELEKKLYNSKTPGERSYIN